MIVGLASVTANFPHLATRESALSTENHSDLSD
jgi:hypothetical protein